MYSQLNGSSSWNETQILNASQGDKFGVSVSMSDDVLAVGAQGALQNIGV